MARVDSVQRMRQCDVMRVSKQRKTKQRGKPMATLSRDETMKAMDYVQSEAADAISGDDVDAFQTVAVWWDSHYRRAGHKRLARTLLEYRDVR